MENIYASEVDEQVKGKGRGLQEDVQQVGGSGKWEQVRKVTSGGQDSRICVAERGICVVCVQCAMSSNHPRGCSLSTSSSWSSKVSPRFSSISDSSKLPCSLYPSLTLRRTRPYVLEGLAQVPLGCVIIQTSSYTSSGLMGVKASSTFLQHLGVADTCTVELLDFG